MITVLRVLKDKFDNVVGYVVSAGNTYSVSVTKEKAKELDVQDLDIIEYFDLPVDEVVQITRGSYALVENNSGFFEEFEDSKKDYFGDKTLYYGYYFEPKYIVSLDNDSAIRRMMLEDKKIYID